MVSALAMNGDKIGLVVFAIFWFVLFILSRRFHWDKLVYAQFKDSRIMWFWLDAFGFPQTRENCLRFLFAAWIIGFVLLSASTIAALRSGGLGRCPPNPPTKR